MLTCVSTPSVRRQGGEINPAARGSYADLARNRPSFFERVGDFDLGDPDAIEVRRVDDPTAVRVDPAVDVYLTRAVPLTEGAFSSLRFLGSEVAPEDVAAAFVPDVEGDTAYYAVGIRGDTEDDAVYSVYVGRTPFTLDDGAESPSLVGAAGEGVFGTGSIDEFDRRFSVATSTLRSVGVPDITELEQEDCEELKERIEELEGKLEEKQNELADLKDKRGAAKAKLERLRNQLDDAESELEEKFEEFDSLFDQFKEFMDAQGFDVQTYEKGSFDPPEGTNFVGTSHLDSDTGVGVSFGDADELTEAFDEYEDTFGNSVGEDVERMNELQRRMSELNQEISNLRGKIGDQQDKVDDLDEQIENCQDEIDDLKERLKELREDLEECRDKLDFKEELEDEADEWTEDLDPFTDDFETEIERTKTKIKESKGSDEEKEADRTQVGRAEDCLDRIEALRRQAREALAEAQEAADSGDTERARNKLDEAKKLRRQAEQLKEECRETLRKAKSSAAARGEAVCPPPEEEIVNETVKCLWTGIRDVHRVDSNSQSLTPSEARERKEAFEDALGGVKEFNDFVGTVSDVFDELGLETGISTGTSMFAPIEVGKLVDILQDKWPKLVATRQHVQVWVTYTGRHVRETTRKVCVEGEFETKTEYETIGTLECTTHVGRIIAGNVISEEAAASEYRAIIQGALNRMGSPVNCPYCAEDVDHGN